MYWTLYLELFSPNGVFVFVANSSLALISARATVTSLDVLSMLIASYLYLLCQGIILFASILFSSFDQVLLSSRLTCSSNRVLPIFQGYLRRRSGFLIRLVHLSFPTNYPLLQVVHSHAADF